MPTSLLRSPSLHRAMVGVALLALFLSSTQAGVLVAGKTNPANGHSYSLLDTATWTASEAEAIALGGHLVTINDAAENDWVFDTFVPLLPRNVFALIWIGLNDAAQEGAFVWASGEPVVFTNWSGGQPDNARGNEDYAHLWTPDGIPQAPQVFRQWNDLANDFSGGALFGVVEFPAETRIPEPGTQPLLLGALGAWFLRRPARRTATVD